MGIIDFILQFIIDIFFFGERNSDAKEGVGCIMMVILAIVLILIFLAGIYALTRIF